MVWLVTVLGVLVVGLGGVYLFQRRLLYFPIGAPSGVLPGAESVELVTADGLRLDAWFVPPAHAATARATVLVFPGNAGHRGDRAPIAVGLARRGFATLLVDYRGYGGNPGSPTEDGLAADARAARSWAMAHPSVDPDRLIYLGESLGAAVAIGLAVEAEPAALVLRSPFSSLADVARAHYPFLPVRLLLAERYPSIERMPGLDCPVLIVAGDRDRVVPVEQSRSIARAAAPGRARLVVLAGADHNDPELVAGEQLMDEIDRLWRETVEAPVGSVP
jgi:fermentation-respiration switch protein FrsA (DUF1100 family)